jgi:hypothetical protein
MIHQKLLLFARYRKCNGRISGTSFKRQRQVRLPLPHRRRVHCEPSHLSTCPEEAPDCAILVPVTAPDSILSAEMAPDSILEPVTAPSAILAEVTALSASFSGEPLCRHHPMWHRKPHSACPSCRRRLRMADSRFRHLLKGKALFR